MERQFKGPRRAQRPRHNPDPVTPLPPLFSMGKRQTNPLVMQYEHEQYQRANSSIIETGQHPVVGSFVSKTYYDIKPDQYIFESLYGAACDHIFRRIDRRTPRRMKLGKKTYRKFVAWMLSDGHDPDEGYTFSRQGEACPTQIIIEPEPTLSDTVIICFH